MTEIGTGSFMEVSLVITFLGVAGTFGVMYQKVASLTQTVERLLAAIEKLNETIMSLQERVTKMEARSENL